MSFFQRGLLQLKSPFAEIKRFRSKIDLKRPRRPHFYKQTYLDISEPKYPSFKYMPMAFQCKKLKVSKNRDIENPFETILAKECANWFNHSKMVAFIHTNSIPSYDKFKTMVALKKENMYLRTYGKKIVSMAVTDTPFESVLKLFVSQSQIIFSEEVKAAVLSKILRKTPQFILMAAIIDGRLVSRNEFVEYSEYPSLDIMRSKLCNVLQSSGVNLVSQMTQHQSSLVNNLDEYVRMKQSEDDSKKNSTDSQTPDVESVPES
ncbi:mitochondrial ribosomal protein L10 [Arctopsyche grandis]|uniref:mitochondrial ribosomal protein L10 n=1 Tax=Arctopsyche grandis TaxID=121162 RepID=UPI00406D8048